MTPAGSDIGEYYQMP